MTITKTITLYTFSELSDKAKETARNWWREAGNNYSQDDVIEDAKEIAALMGIEIKKVFFSGFWSQGDGSCFEGQYSYDGAKGAIAKVKAFAPNDTELHRIVTGLCRLQRVNFYKLSASIRHSGPYYHEHCTAVDVRKGGEYFFDTDDSYVSNSAHDGAKLIGFLHDFMRWIYSRLKAAYDAENTDEAIDEALIANEYTFRENGKRED